MPNCDKTGGALHLGQRGKSFALLLIAGGLSSSSAFGAATATDSPLGLMGAKLGMSLAEWRTMPPPAKLGNNVKAACSSDPAAAVGSLKPTPAEMKAGIVICGYVSQYGSYSFPQQFPLYGAFQSTATRYDFKDGRLTEIDCEASVNAYNALVAKLKGQYGASSQLVRDQVASELGALPRVTQTWITPRGIVRLQDPVAPFSQLRLSVAMPGTSVGAGG